MDQLDLIQEIIAPYSRHGWVLRLALLRAETRARALEGDVTALVGVTVQESTVDALWFSRPSHAGREAWELRLVSETPYALFETFEAGELEEDREEVRREMEARLMDYASRP